MAGSYEHCVNDDNSLREPDEITVDNMGDAYEAIEHMYWMIYLLSQGDKKLIGKISHEALKKCKY